MSGQPTGTVTFLFTDIEGSTKLWEHAASAMHTALARHDEILRDTVKSHGGYVFKEVGDAFCCAFASAPEAVGAALAAQRALVEEPWGETEPLRVRMAIHTGVAEERGGDYFGPPPQPRPHVFSRQVMADRCFFRSPAQELARKQSAGRHAD